MTKLYLDKNGYYKREKKDKVNWMSVIAKAFLYLIFFSLFVIYIYLLLQEG